MLIFCSLEPDCPAVQNLIASDAARYRQRHPSKAANADRTGCRRAQIYDPPPHEWTAIVDPHHHGTTVVVVDDGDAGAEWQCSMGGGHGAGIHALSTCGMAPAIDRGDA